MTYTQLQLSEDLPVSVKAFVRKSLEPYLMDVHVMLGVTAPTTDPKKVPHLLGHSIALTLLTVVSSAADILFTKKGTNKEKFVGVLSEYYPWDKAPASDLSKQEATELLYNEFRNPIAHRAGIRPAGGRIMGIYLPFPGLSDPHQNIIELERSDEPPSNETLNIDSATCHLELHTFYWGVRTMIEAICADKSKWTEMIDWIKNHRFMPNGKAEVTVATQQARSFKNIQNKGRTKIPFDDTSTAHTVVNAVEKLGYDLSNPEAFLKRLQHVEYGLSAEIEFAALLRWLGACSFVHRLNDDVFVDRSRSDWQIPDLFASFSVDGHACSNLIEVKTTKGHILKLKKSYLNSLQNYARILNQHLLIAWRPRDIGYWLLVDPIHTRAINRDTLEIDFDTASKNDLMSLLAGDYFIVPKRGAGLRIEAERISEKEPTKDGYQAVFKIAKAFFHDTSGKEVKDVPESITWTIFSTLEEHQDVNDEGFVQSFLTSGGMTRAQLVLRTAAIFPLEEDQRIHWKEVGTNLDAILSCGTLLTEAQAYFGTFIQYIYHQQPLTRPAFLPDRWRAKDT